MKKKRRKQRILAIMLIAIASICLSPVVKGALTDGLMVYYTFDNDFNDSTNFDRDATNQGATRVSGCKIDGCVSFTTDDYIEFDHADLLNIQDDFSISIWVKADAGAANADTVWQRGQWNGAGESIQFVYSSGYGGLYATIEDATGSDVWDANGLGQNFDHFVLTVRDDGASGHGATLYKNGTNISAAYWSSFGTSNSHFELGRRGNAFNDRYWEGDIDEFGVWNRSLTPAEVTSLFNGGDGLAYPFAGDPVGDTPSCTITIDETNPSKLNYSYSTNPDGYYYINVSWESTNNSNYYNSSYTFGIWTISDEMINNLTNEAINMNDQADLSDTFAINLTNENASCIGNVSNIRYDFINPTWSTDFINQSTFNVTANNDTDAFEYYVEFVDTNLDGYEVTIYNQNEGTELVEKIYLEGLTETTYRLNISTDWENITTDMTVGDSHTIVWNITVWDSHNPLTRPVRPIEFDIDQTSLTAINNNLLFYGEDVKFGYNHLGQPFTYFYLSENKYKMKITFQEDRLYHSIYINTSDWEIVQDSQYKGHLINRKLRKWLDFEGENIDTVNIIKQDFGYLIDLKLKERSDELEIESLGDLNVVNQQITFTVNLLPVLYSEILHYLPLYTALLTSIDNHLSNIEVSVDLIQGALTMLWYTILFIFMVTFGYHAATHYNYGFGLPFIMGGLLLGFRYVLENLSGDYWYLGTIMLGVIFVSFIGLWFLKSIRNRHLFLKD